MILQVLMLLSLVMYVACLWQIFAKANISSRHSLVPIYNTWELMKISGKPAWWSLLSVPPFIFLAGSIVYPALFMILIVPQDALVVLSLSILWIALYVDAMIGLGKRFGQTKSFSVFLMALSSLLTWVPIGFVIVAFDKRIQYKDPKSTVLEPVPQTPTPEQPTYVNGQ